MVNKCDETREDALRCITQLVTLEQRLPSWEIDSLVSKSFFSGIPGVLTADYQELPKCLPPLFEELPDVQDLRPLTRDELLEFSTMQVFLELWSAAICIRSGQQSNEVRSLMVILVLASKLF